MEYPRAPQEVPRKPSAGSEPCCSGMRLTHTRGARNYVTCPVVDYLAPCTATDDNACHITFQLTQWNAFLFPAGFELQELPDARGRLSLASFNKPSFGFPGPSESESSRSNWAVYRLLTTHRCIVSLHITASQSASTERLLCSALMRNTSLKSLKLQFSEEAKHWDLAVVTQHLTSRDMFGCNAYTESPADIAAALCTLFRTSSSLTSFKMNGFFLEEHEKKRMLAALMDNSTLKEFSADGFFSLESCQEEFTNYLWFATTLTTLCMAPRNVETQLSLLRGVLKNRTLESLSLGSFIRDDESTRLVANIFLENEVLLSFSIASTRGDPRLHREGDYDWIATLAENNTLEKLGLPLSIWPPASWANFFTVLSSKPNLKKVHIVQDLLDFTILSAVCRVLAESGVEERVSFGTCVVINNVDLTKCRAFSEIYLAHGPDENRSEKRYVAGSLERVSQHTALLEDLAELRHATKDSTAVSVKASLRSVESMDAFMRLAGVVRERVVCCTRDDGHLQLDQLNEYCWSHVRRYLMLEDIKNSVTQIVQTKELVRCSTSRPM